MIKIVSKFWWLYALRGLLAVLFGLAAFFWPQITVTVLVLLFGLYLLFEGILLIAAAFGGRSISTNWWVVLLEGVICVGFAILALAWPGITAIVLLFLIAAWALVSGIVEIIAAFQLRKVIEGEWILGLTGVLSILVAMILSLRPNVGALAVVWFIGFYALLFGTLMLYLAFKIRRLPASIYIQWTDKN
jgi:uncharacterized membrane protein HdeD (DUF308 family)